MKIADKVADMIAKMRGTCMPSKYPMLMEVQACTIELMETDRAVMKMMLKDAHADLDQLENAMRAIQAITAHRGVLDITDRALAGTFDDDERTAKGTH